VVIRHKSDKEGRNKDLISGPFCKVWYCVLFFSLTFGLLPPALEYYTYTAATGGADRAMPMRRLRLGGHCLEQKAHGARNPGRRRLGWLPSGLLLSLCSWCKGKRQEMPGRGTGEKGKDDDADRRGRGASLAPVEGGWQRQRRSFSVEIWGRFFLLSDDVCQCVAMPHVWLRSRSDPHVTVLGLAITNQLRNLEPNREKTQILRLSI
jgi:hypothetical protein